MLTVIGWMLLGLLAGTAAKLLVPGKDPGGLLLTMFIGMAGAFVGGYGARLLGIGEVSGIDFASLSFASLGAVLLLVAYRFVRGGF